MADKGTIQIEAFDCLPFTNSAATAGVLQEFIETQTGNVFWFSNDFIPDDDSKLAEYDYRNKCWTAGRFVGEAIFNSKGTDYRITIKPRFGEKMLFRMLEEIFNVRITTSASQHSASKDWQHYIKRIIAYIWLQRLASANLHGLPKVHVKHEHRGQSIRGRLDVRKSLQPLHMRNEVVSLSREKRVDSTIAQILYHAYRILETDFDVGSVNVPESAQDAINHVSSAVYNYDHISENDYKAIRYKDIYYGWKSVVDLSWDIIKRKSLSLRQDKAQKGFGFFIDMAEVWEQYLRALLKKALLPHGWHYRNEKQVAYKGYFFQRELIPDLVFQKGDEVAVWDAKYKRMLGRHFDVDRSDFFQIHTYIQNFLYQKKVKAGGLLYPISQRKTDFMSCTSPFLLHEEGNEVKFSIDGIVLPEVFETDDPKPKEAEFITRMLSYIEP